MKSLHQLHILTVTVLSAFTTLYQADLNLRPSDIFTREGSSVELQCGSALNQSVYWYVTRPGSTDKSPVYQGDIVESYKPRFSFDKSQGHGMQILKVKGVLLEDGGMYTCVDDGGFGTGDAQTATANIVVLAKSLECLPNVSADGALQPNVVCNLPRDFINFTCIARYRGNEAPSLHWTLNGGDVTHDVRSSVERNVRVVSTALLQVGDLNPSERFVCTVVTPRDKSTGELINFSWTSPPVQLLREADGRKANGYNGLVAAVIILVVIVVFLAVAFVVYCWHNRRQQHQQQTETKAILVVKDDADPVNVTGDGEHANPYDVVDREPQSTDSLLVPPLNTPPAKPPRQSGSSSTSEQPQPAQTTVTLPVIPTIAIRKGAEIRGVAAIDNQLFVARAKNHKIEGYDILHYNLLRIISIPDCNPCDMTSSATILFITDFFGKSVYVVDTSGKTNVTKFQTGDEKPDGISVTTNGNVLVAFREAGKIREYATNGELIQEISPHAGIAGEVKPMIRHAMQLGKAAEYLVCSGYRGGTSDDQPFSLFVVDAEGRLLRKFEQNALYESKSAKHTVNHVAMDAHGNVFAADFFNNRALLLDAKLDGAQECGAHEIVRPFRLHFNERQGCLYIGEHKDGGRLWACKVNYH